ncbi:MAG: hypothetical protein HPY76_01125 [Anaerolineae bacterium]|nr:hypothetical protein [Anaerolineae bacterium]
MKSRLWTSWTVILGAAALMAGCAGSNEAELARQATQAAATIAAYETALAPTATPLVTATITASPTPTDLPELQNPPERVFTEFAGSPDQREIYLEYSDGSRVFITDDDVIDQFPYFSPSGLLVVFTRFEDTNGDGVSDWSGDEADLFLYDMLSGERRNLTQTPAYYEDVTWSWGGERLAFVSDREPGRALYTLDIQTGEVRQLTPLGLSPILPAWSADDRWIAFYGEDGENGRCAYAVRADGSGEPVRISDDIQQNSYFMSWETGGRMVFAYRGGYAFGQPERFGVTPVSDPAGVETPMYQFWYGWTAYSISGLPE